MDLEIDREDTHRLDVKSRHVVVWRTETHFDTRARVLSRHRKSGRFYGKSALALEEIASDCRINKHSGIKYSRH